MSEADVHNSVILENSVKLKNEIRAELVEKWEHGSGPRGIPLD